MKPASQMTNFGAQNRQHQRQHQDILLSMRKHRSLDGSQFLSHLADPASSTYPAVSAASGMPEFANVEPFSFLPNEQQQTSQYSTQNPNNFMPYSYMENLFEPNYSSAQPYPLNSSSYRSFAGRSGGGAYALESENEMFKRELVATEQKLSYVMNTIQTFWSPELKKERQLRKEEALRSSQMKYKLCQQASEIQVVRDELEKREKEIGQLLSESDLGEMEEELRRLRKQLREPRDFTEKTLSMHELQTIKTKMERSELTLAEKERDLHNCEVRLKCTEEQRAELEKRIDILSKTNSSNEGQLKLLQDDLNVLRKKLENKNQLLESRENTVKGLEKELDIARNQIQELLQNRQENEHRNSSLSHRIEQLETLLRERDSQLDRTKQLLLQQPGNRLEKELQLRAENAEHDKNNLEKLVESLQQNTELDKQNQLQTFQEESRHLHKTIDYLQKELTDRTMLIASQNEKISQLDTQSKNLLELENKSRNDSTTQNVDNLKGELEETRKEVERLLRIVQNLEKEKTQLSLRLSENNRTNSHSNGLSEVSVRSTKLAELNLSRDEDGGAMRIRVGELEEALRESVGITAEREKLINEQKLIIQQLSTQMNELNKVSGSRVDQKIIQSATAKVDTLQKALEEERSKFQRQLTNVRKEVGMELIKEKDACINLLQSPPDSLKEKIEILTRQKEQLKHRLLVQGNDVFSTSEGGPYLGNAWQNLGKTSSSLELASALYQQQQRPNNVFTTMSSNGINTHPYSNPISVVVPPMGIGISAPASLLHYGRDEVDDDGIWA